MQLPKNSFKPERPVKGGASAPRVAKSKRKTGSASARGWRGLSVTTHPSSPRSGELGRNQQSSEEQSQIYCCGDSPLNIGEVMPPMRVPFVAEQPFSESFKDGVEAFEAKKKVRFVIKPVQKKRLEYIYSESRFLSKVELDQVAHELDLPRNTTKNWFQNKRASERRKNQKLKLAAAAAAVVVAAASASAASASASASAAAASSASSSSSSSSSASSASASAYSASSALKKIVEQEVAFGDAVVKKSVSASSIYSVDVPHGASSSSSGERSWMSGAGLTQSSRTAGSGVQSDGACMLSAKPAGDDPGQVASFLTPILSFPAMRSNFPAMRSNFPAMRSNYSGMGSDYSGMGSDYSGMGSNYSGMGSNYPGMGLNPSQSWPGAMLRGFQPQFEGYGNAFPFSGLYGHAFSSSGGYGNAFSSAGGALIQAGYSNLFSPIAGFASGNMPFRSDVALGEGVVRSTQSVDAGREVSSSDNISTEQESADDLHEHQGGN